jgi:hypothetical protein
MLESRWGRRAGPALATLGALLAVASTALGAPAISDRPPPDCSGSGAPTVEAAAWYALDPVVERGVLGGQRLTLGRLDGDGWTVGLPAEAWATGPVDGQVLFGWDDGRRSTIRAFDAGRGCMQTVATVTDIVRSATLDPAGGALHEHRLARTDRRDLGLWLRRSGAEAAERVLPGAGTDERFGPTWQTHLLWSDDRRHLVVASCGELACRFRIVDRSGAVRVIDDPRLGAPVGLLDGRLVARGACRGLPCPVLSVDPATGATSVLDAAAGSVAPIAGEDGGVVVAGLSEATATLRRIDVRSARPESLPGGGVPLPVGAGYGADLPAGWFLVTEADDATVRADTLRARPLDRAARPLQEVRP